MNLAHIVTQIQQDYPESEIEGLLQEKLKTISPRTYQREGYENAKELYRDCGNGEYDDEVIDDLILYWERHYNRGPGLSEGETSELHDLLLEAYGVLA